MRGKDPNYIPGAHATAARPPPVDTATGAAMEALPTGLGVCAFEGSAFRSPPFTSPPNPTGGHRYRGRHGRRCSPALRFVPCDDVTFAFPSRHL